MELRFPSPGLRAQSATLGIDTKRDSNAVGVAFSRRRYLQQDNGLRCVGGVVLNSICNILPNPCSPSCATGNALGWLVTAVTRSRIVRHVPTFHPLRTTNDGRGRCTPADRKPLPDPPKGRGLFPAVSKAFARSSRPLGRVGEGLSECRGGAFGGPGRGLFPTKNRRADRHGWHPRLRL